MRVPLSALGSLTLIVGAGADMIVLADIPFWIEDVVPWFLCWFKVLFPDFCVSRCLSLILNCFRRLASFSYLALQLSHSLIWSWASFSVLLSGHLSSLHTQGQLLPLMVHVAVMKVRNGIETSKRMELRPCSSRLRKRKTLCVVELARARK